MARERLQGSRTRSADGPEERCGEVDRKVEKEQAEVKKEQAEVPGACEGTGDV